jgi:hypothetical protein
MLYFIYGMVEDGTPVTHLAPKVNSTAIPGRNTPAFQIGSDATLTNSLRNLCTIQNGVNIHHLPYRPPKESPAK